MDFSVVIPTYNRLDMLVRVLDALDAQVAAPSFEVIVINDGSRDDTDRVMSQRKGITLRTQPNGGPGRARNHGVSLARGRYVVFIGDDTVPEPRFLAEHARVHAEANHDPLVACLGYTGWPATERVTAFMDYINDYGLQFGYKLIRHGEVVPYNFFYTSNISIDRDIRGVEEVVRDDLAMADQLVAELQAVVVDVIHERGHALGRRPARVAEACDERIVVRFSVNACVLGEKARLRHRVVAD